MFCRTMYSSGIDIFFQVLDIINHAMAKPKLCHKQTFAEKFICHSQTSLELTRRALTAREFSILISYPSKSYAHLLTTILFSVQRLATCYLLDWWKELISH